jgi:hypothetical protein
LHHRHVHEYGYAIELGPDQRPRFRDPHGRPVAAVPEHPHAVDLGWPHIRATNEALQIDADTIAGPWDGTPVDYGQRPDEERVVPWSLAIPMKMAPGRPVATRGPTTTTRGGGDRTEARCSTAQKLQANQAERPITPGCTSRGRRSSKAKAKQKIRATRLGEG